MRDFPVVAIAGEGRVESAGLWVEPMSDGTLCIGSTGEFSGTKSCTADSEIPFTLSFSIGQTRVDGEAVPDVQVLRLFASSNFERLTVLDAGSSQEICETSRITFDGIREIAGFRCEVPLDAEPRSVELLLRDSSGGSWLLDETIVTSTVDEMFPDLTKEELDDLLGS